MKNKRSLIQIKVSANNKVLIQEYFFSDTPLILKHATWDSICNRLKVLYPKLLHFKPRDYKERKLFINIKVLRKY